MQLERWAELHAPHQNNMKLITDPEKVKELAAAKEEENWRFRSFLKGTMGVIDLDPVVHAHYAAVAAQIDCTSCGNCCRGLIPDLMDSDIERLAAGLKMPVAKLEERRITTSEDGSRTFNELPCPFLEGKACTVYDHRPHDCRSFPHLDKDSFVFRLTQTVQACAICPIVYNFFEILKEEYADEFRKELDDLGQSK